jgi:Gpi18-like mannosyltransferase
MDKLLSKYLHKHKRIIVIVSFLLLLNSALYLFIYFFHSSIPFNIRDYKENSNHFYEDPIATQGQFNLLRSLGQYDAQWYLKIASEGYVYQPVQQYEKQKNDIEKNGMNILSYAFFPLYPLVLALVNTVFHNVELAAFVLANVLIIINGISLYVVLSKFYSNTIAMRTVFLLFSFPFSIFYRSYFSEGLSLFFLIWFSYFFLKKRYIQAAFLLGLLSVTRASALFINVLFLFYLLREGVTRTLSVKKIVFSVFLLSMPCVLWLVFCYLQTGDFFFFNTVREFWNIEFPFAAEWFRDVPYIVRNLVTVLIFFGLPAHLYHFSQLEIISILTMFVLLVVSRKKIDKKLWWISLLFFAAPLFTTDTMSFTRYQMISFPLFLYLALILNDRRYYLTLFSFLVLLFLVSLVFINWYWVG